jgi:hypothetical protein
MVQSQISTNSALKDINIRDKYNKYIIANYYGYFAIN